MNFYYISKNSEETSKLEKAIESLQNSKCFDVLSGPRDFNVSHKGDAVILTPLDAKTHLVLCNLYKNKDFKIDSVDVQLFPGRFNLEFYIGNTHYIVKSNGE